MRIPAQTDRPRQILNARSPQLVVIRVLTADAVYFSYYEYELSRVDAAGIPTGGWSLTNADPAFILNPFLGTLWMRGSVLNTDVEISYTPI